ncbi:MAG: hypothetical protein EA396_15030 [Anaerolineaceae bacterium]|nr:MAG: hypothetical protein EA396_15030 [Anaerolineaceae bacterium]
MTAYVNGQLSPAARSRVARYIDAYPVCYAEYTRHRDLQRELAATIPALGRPDSARLDKIWANVSREMQTPGPMRYARPAQRRLTVCAVLTVLLMFFLLGLFRVDVPLTGGQASPDAWQVAAATSAPVQIPARTASATPAPDQNGDWIEITDPAATAQTPPAAITPDQSD